MMRCCCQYQPATKDTSYLHVDVKVLLEVVVALAQAEEGIGLGDRAVAWPRTADDEEVEVSR